MSKARNIGPLRVRPQVVKGKATGKWFVDIPSTLTSTGKRKRKLYASRMQAEKIARGVANGLKFKQLGFAKKATRSSITLHRGVDLWVEHQEYRVKIGKLRSSSLVTRNCQLIPVKSFFRNCDLALITSEEIGRYQLRRLSEGCKEVTINSEVAALRQVLKWLRKKGELETLPEVENLEVPKAAHVIPNSEEVVKVIGHLHPQHRTLVRLMAETGLRPGEAYNLPWCHIDLTEGYLTVQPFEDWQPKNKSTHRRVWLSSGLRAEMRRLPRNGTFVFSGRDPNKPITGIKKALASAVDKACLTRSGKPMRITPKTFRKAYATWQAERGTPQSILQRQMGHVPGSRMTEQHYIHVRDAALKEAMFQLPDTAIAEAVAKSGNGSGEGAAGAAK